MYRPQMSTGTVEVGSATDGHRREINGYSCLFPAR